MNQFELALMNLKYQLSFNSLAEITSFISSEFSSKLDSWVDLEVADTDCIPLLQFIRDDRLPYYLDKREENEAIKSTMSSSIQNQINGVIDKIEELCMIKQIREVFEKDDTEYAMMLFSRLVEQIDRCTQGTIKIPFYVLGAGFENVTYGNPDVRWYYQSLLKQLGSIQVVNLDVYKEIVTVTNPYLIKKAYEKMMKIREIRSEQHRREYSNVRY